MQHGSCKRIQQLRPLKEYLEAQLQMILFQHPEKCSITMCLSKSVLRVCQCKLLLRPFRIPNFPPTYAKCHFALSSSQLCKIPLKSNLASFCVLFPVWRPPSASGYPFCFEMEERPAPTWRREKIEWGGKAKCEVSSWSGQRFA